MLTQVFSRRGCTNNIFPKLNTTDTRVDIMWKSIFVKEILQVDFVTL